MTNPQSIHAPTADQVHRWLTAAASLAVGGAFFSLWFWLLPRWLGFSVEMAGAGRGGWAGAGPPAVGFFFVLRCIWGFGGAGAGPPRPGVSPPRVVVVGVFLYPAPPQYFG